MNSKVVRLRREVLPSNIFEVIEDYMNGNLVSIHILAVTPSGRIINTSAGDVPDVLRKHDSIKKRG